MYNGQYKSVFNTSAVTVTLLAFAAERRRLLSIDMSYPQGAQQQTRRTPLLLSIDRTDGRTLDRFIDPHTVGSIKNYDIGRRYSVTVMQYAENKLRDDDSFYHV